MALRFFNGSKVRSYLGWLHDYLAQKKDSRAYDLTDHTHHAYNGMYSRQISAAGSQLFPDVGNRIDTDHIDTYIGKKQEIIHHLVEHPGIAVVQIPLIRIERGHDIMSDLRKICEVSRGSRWKYLGNRFFIFLGNAVIVKEEITAHVLAFPFSCTHCPLMIF